MKGLAVFLTLAAALVFSGCPAAVSSAPEDLGWTAEADGTADSVTSTVINFTFGNAIGGLTAEQIIVADDTGSVTAGDLSGAGKDWSLAIEVAAAGNVKVRIEKDGIEAGEKAVTVHRKKITWTAEADGVPGTKTSTAIVIAFSETISGLTAEEIFIANDSGAAAQGALAESGESWVLAISVESAGDVKVRIAKEGVEAVEKAVAVYRQGEINTFSYTATANGGEDTETSTALVFTFSGAISGLTDGDITLADATGSVSRGGALAGSGQNWTLPVTVTKAGDVKVRINREGIQADEKTVTVHKEKITWTAEANGGAGATTSTAIAFTFNKAVAGLNASQITLANGTGSVTKGGLTGYGTRWSLAITVTAPGTVMASIDKEGVDPAGKSVTVHVADLSPIDPGEEPDPDAEAVKTGIAILSLPETTIYSRGMQFDRTGLLVAWAYDDGSVETIPDGGYALTEPDMTRFAPQQITVSAGGFSARFAINVIDSDKVLASISVSGSGYEDQVFYRDFDRTNLVITGHYSDRSTQNVTSYATIAGYNKYERGPQNVTARVNGKTAAIPGIRVRIPSDMTVIMPYRTATVSEVANNYRRVYFRGQSIDMAHAHFWPEVTTANGTVILRYEDGTILDSDTVSGYDPDIVGRQVATLHLDGKAGDFDVSVIELEPDIWFDYGYRRGVSDPKGAGPGAGKYYARPGETLTLSPVRFLIG